MSVHAMSSEQASAVKRRGHQREGEFNQRFGFPEAEINWSGSSADCLLNESRLPMGFAQWAARNNVSLGSSVSLKSGNTIQVHLGNLPELTNKEEYYTAKNALGQTVVDHAIPFEEQQDTLKSRAFWEKYLKKGDVMCYVDDINGEYLFFKMDDVISFIIDKCEWRLLPTGRLKGDFFGKQVLTYEYRSRKKSFLLGAGGASNGKKFINILKENLDVFVVEK